MTDKVTKYDNYDDFIEATSKGNGYWYQNGRKLLNPEDVLQMEAATYYEADSKRGGAVHKAAEFAPRAMSENEAIIAALRTQSAHVQKENRLMKEALEKSQAANLHLVDRIIAMNEAQHEMSMATTRSANDTLKTIGQLSQNLLAAADRAAAAAEEARNRTFEVEKALADVENQAEQGVMKQLIEGLGPLLAPVIMQRLAPPASTEQDES